LDAGEARVFNDGCEGSDGFGSTAGVATDSGARLDEGEL
jgi:hypothetical protein